jgi:hypothetical protein
MKKINRMIRCARFYWILLGPNELAILGLFLITLFWLAKLFRLLI